MIGFVERLDIGKKGVLGENLQKAGLSVGIPSWDEPSWEPASAASANIQIGRFVSVIDPNSRSWARVKT